jgi:hypothetical protein
MKLKTKTLYQYANRKAGGWHVIAGLDRNPGQRRA